MKKAAAGSSAPFADDEEVIEGGATPHGLDAHFESGGGEHALELRGIGIARGGGFHPEAELGDVISEHGDAEAPGVIAEAGADDELPACGHAGGGGSEQGVLLGFGEELQDVQDDDMPSEVGQAVAAMAWAEWIFRVS
jgi:hypothetical protein